MMPVGPLMIEHRRIERMITIIGREFDRIQDEKKVNPAKIDIFVDFIRFYADRCHHGKEEDRHFFLPCMRYFSSEEKEAMLQECREFDRNLIHEKYRHALLETFLQDRHLK